MVYIGPGFTPGRFGRMTPARFDRRVYYLAAEHDRDAVILAGTAEAELSIEQAIEALGKDSEYHEIVIAMSFAESDAMRARRPDDPRGEALASGHRVAKRLTKGKPYILVLHEQDGRFHFHLAARGPLPTNALGRHGEVQRAWDLDFFRTEGRVIDWDAHRRFQASKTQLQALIRQQQEHERQRREEVRAAAPAMKSEVGRGFERKSRELIEQRYLLELSTLEARYESRGTQGSPEHRAERERAEFRRTAALHRLEHREHQRQMQDAKGRITQILGDTGRHASKAICATGQVSRTALDQALREMGAPRPLRAGARLTVTLATEASQAALRAALEASKAAARSALHCARGGASLAVGLVAAPFTGGASLTKGMQQVGQELSAAAQEAGKGLARTAQTTAQGVGNLAQATAREATPRELRTISDVVAGQPERLISQALPQELRRALQVAGVLPASPISVALRLAADLARNTQPHSRALEVDR
jgi:hypothetical protein